MTNRGPWKAPVKEGVSGLLSRRSFWPNNRVRAAAHESALALYDLSDVLPVEVHVTVRRTAARRRKGIRTRTNRLRPADIVKNGY